MKKYFQSALFMSCFSFITLSCNDDGNERNTYNNFLTGKVWKSELIKKKPEDKKAKDSILYLEFTNKKIGRNEKGILGLNYKILADKELKDKEWKKGEYILKNGKLTITIPTSLIKPPSEIEKKILVSDSQLTTNGFEININGMLFTPQL